MKLSVAMCTFNGRRFLPMQLDSIRAQDRQPDELVVCDDGSSDDSDEMVREFGRRVLFPVRCIRNDLNLGSTKNFERTVLLCQGTVIVLADQDDIWYPSKLDRIEKAFLGSAEVVAAFSDADLIDDESVSLKLRLWQSFSFGRGEQMRFANDQALNILVKHPVVTGATMAFRREFLEYLLPIPANHVHDRWISFLLAACGKFVPIAEPLMQYRRHASQQIGPGNVTWRERIARARTTGPNFYLEEIERFHQLQERLESQREHFPRAERALIEIERKVSHHRHRANLSSMSGSRIGKVLREALNGSYWRYSEGWASVAKDLTLAFRR